MSAPQTFRVAGSGGLLRIVVCRPEDLMRIMHRIGIASYTAEVTTRPAYREMIDTIRWEDIR
ncbi:hypothetical protein LOK46_13700 [Methylobacterium sp. NMS14P]|uniref:hypothetical protein n=1 Tax=Methylobacterium sp. NMS14P TaxID=2894310 RepID=UPI00235A149F|nr:hypothetical protein [Methylobacterium sp. NMS14P]WCS27830.1 hypothetical protein LOK46_13700 [Methylobacterium sp. NMS14P]